jgi:hypothetical protein
LSKEFYSDIYICFTPQARWNFLLQFDFIFAMPPFLCWVTFGPRTWYVLLITFKILKTFGGFD